MHCVHCGNEIPAEGDFCSKCGKRAIANKPAVRAGFVVALLLVVFVSFGLVVHFIRADNAAAQIRPNGAAQFYAENIEKAFTVPQLHHKAYKFAVPTDARDTSLHGHFAATGGAHNDIEVSLMSQDDFVNWQNRHPITPIWSSGRVTQATLNIPLPNPGTYYLVFNNHFSIVSPKAIEDDVTLIYRR